MRADTFDIHQVALRICRQQVETSFFPPPPLAVTSVKHILCAFLLSSMSCGLNQAQMETSEETTASQHPLGATDSCTDPASSIYPIAGYYTLKDGTTISIWNEPGAKGDALGVVIKRGEKTLGGYFRLETSDSQSAWFLKDSKPQISKFTLYKV